MWNTSSNLATHKTKRRFSLPLGIAKGGIAKDRDGPLTGRRPSSKKSIKITPYGNEMGEGQERRVAKKNRINGQERDQYRKSSYWKQKVYNINYSRMQDSRSCVQVWMGCWGKVLFNFFFNQFFSHRCDRRRNHINSKCTHTQYPPTSHIPNSSKRRAEKWRRN